MKDITAETVAKKFYKNWIAPFGTPVKIITDQGKQFTLNLFKNLAKLTGAKVANTTAYHPQCNGKVERLDRTLKAALRPEFRPVVRILKSPESAL